MTERVDFEAMADAYLNACYTAGIEPPSKGACRTWVEHLAAEGFRLAATTPGPRKFRRDDKVRCYVTRLGIVLHTKDQSAWVASYETQEVYEVDVSELTLVKAAEEGL